MVLKQLPTQETATGLIDAIRTFPRMRTVEHCGAPFQVDSLTLYATCPRCGARLKVRGFSAETEIEDVIDAVLEWLDQPGAEAVARRSLKAGKGERPEELAGDS